MTETNEELDYKELEDENRQLKKMIEEIRMVYEGDMWIEQHKHSLYWRYVLSDIFKRYGQWRDDS